MVVDDRSLASDTRRSDQEAIEALVAPYGDRLVRLFWNIIHPSYPILYKAGLIKSYSKGYRNVDAPLLGAVYLMALNWWDYDSHLSPRQRPDSLMLRRLVEQALQSSYHRPRVTSIEAALLLLQCKPEDPLNPDHTYARGLVQQMLGIAEAIGLHLDASSWDVPDWERKLRLRVGHAIYMQDKWTALAYGRPSHVSTDNWAVPDLTQQDFEVPDSTDQTGQLVDTEAGNKLFIEMINLTRILDDVMQQFLTLRQAKNQDTADLFYRSQPLLHRLDAWLSYSAQELRIEGQPLQRLCPSGYLHLAFHAVKISLLRRLIRSTALAPLCLDVNVLSEVRRLASQAGSEAVTFVSQLRADHLEAFWFFSSPFAFSLIGSFITLLLVTARVDAEQSYWREKLNKYLWNLRLMSKTSEPMRYAVKRLEGAILKGMEHALAVDLDERPSLATGSDAFQTSDLDFMGFADMESLQLEAFDFLNGVSFDDFSQDVYGRG